MKPEPPYDHTGEIAKINFSLCYALVLVSTAVWIWPSDPRWYAFYGFSVILCLAAFGLVFNALRTMRRLQKTRKRWEEILEHGNAPKNATLLSKRDLQRKDMN